jgi:hypothetical protein
MTLILLAAAVALLLLIADVAIGRPDRLARHATASECLAARLAPGRVALTVAVAAALPLFGLAQLLKVTAVAVATLAGPHLAATLAA